jgi:hypothetical protein
MSGIPHVHIGDPHLFGQEPALFASALGTSRRYLEFGTGGSTLLAIRQGIGAMVAVESDPAWIDALRKHPEIVGAIGDGKLGLVHGDVGPVAPLGYPRDYASGTQDKVLWPNYIRAGWQEVSKRGYVPDLVYVDGRFRVGCCLSVVLACKDYVPVGQAPQVLVHDIAEDRPHYEPIFRFFDVVEAVNTLRLLRIKADASTLDAFALLMDYQFDPR